MCSGSHGQTAGSYSRPRVKKCECGEPMEKVREALVVKGHTTGNEMVWHCSKCGKYEYVD